MINWILKLLLGNQDRSRPVNFSSINLCRGFSTVDLVSEAGTDRLFALKKIRCHSTEDEAAAEKEIQYHKQISHPSVIECKGSVKIGSADISNNRTSMVLLLLPLYKVCANWNTNHYFTSYWCNICFLQYGSLQTLLEKRALRKEPLTTHLILDYFLQICEGLAAIHATGTAHRDLKPGNVLLAPNDRVVIMDLG